MGNKEALVEIIAYPGKLVPSAYVNLIKSRWIRNYKKDNDFMRLVYPPAYYIAYGAYVDGVLKKPSTIVRLAVLEEDNDVVMGFSVMDSSTLHYVHVPKGYRRQGIGRLLVPEYIEYFTHLTKIGVQIWHKKFPKAKFNPFI